MMSKVCVSYCDGFCGLDYEDDDDRPSSMDDQELCLDDGEDKDCTEFYAEGDD